MATITITADFDGRELGQIETADYEHVKSEHDRAIMIKDLTDLIMIADIYDQDKFDSEQW